MNNVLRADGAQSNSLWIQPANVARCLRLRAWSLFLILYLLAVDAAFAQKAPQLGYVFPPAIRAGELADVHLGGFDFTPDMQWFVHDARVKLQTSGVPGDYQLTPPPYWTGPHASVGQMPLTREVAGQFDVDPALPAGLVLWQVASANGCSQTAVVYVSHGQEILESRSRDLPQRLPTLPVAVSGRLSRLTEVDRYEVVADHDGPISIDLMARRLGAGFNGMLQVRDSAGQLLADLSDTQGLDGGVTFAARAGETYTIALNDADFRGDRTFIYRLAVTSGPRVVGTLPAAGQRGTSRELEFVGLGIASGKPELESFREVVSFPADPSMVAHTHPLKTPFGTVDVTIPLSDLEEQVGVVSSLPTAPIAITNIMPPDTDQQRFSWSVAKDERWSLDLQSRAIGGRLDAGLSVLDPDGKLVAENDDLPGTTDAGLEFLAATSGTFTCVVRSMASRLGTKDELYRLQIRRSVPDFSITVPQQINVPLSGKVEVPVQVMRSGGFDGEIVLAVEGLPAGVSATGAWTIPAGTNELKVVIEAVADAAVVAGALQFRGTGKIGDVMVTRPATAVAAGNLCPRSPADQRITTVLLAVTMTPPFDVLLVDRTRQRDVHRGSTCLVEMEIVRKDGFAGEVQLEMAAAQARYLCGSRGLNVRVPPEATRVIYPAWMSEYLGTEFTIRMSTQGVAAVADPKGNLRFLTKPADAAITMIMEGALLKLTTPARESTLRCGESLDVPVVLSRSAKLPVAATIKLNVPDEISGLLQVEPLVLPPGQDQGVLRITSIADPRLLGQWSLSLSASALQDAQWPVISETSLPLVIEGNQE